MKKIMMLVAVLALAVVGFVSTANANPGTGHSPKVVVCKYVGTPGDGERLQTGQNPIEVSSSSLKGFNGSFPYEFADAQGRSIAIGYVGEVVSSIESCPGYVPTPTPDPTPTDTPTVTPTPTETPTGTPTTPVTTPPVINEPPSDQPTDCVSNDSCVPHPVKHKHTKTPVTLPNTGA